MAESQEELQKKLKNMSPEELAAFQKQNCIFCQIIEGKVPSAKVYEDDICIGILDINPAVPGHVLLIPKEHFMVMPQMPEEVIQHMFMAAKGVSHALLRALKAEGTTVFVANGGAAGQRAQHFMIHIIPRNQGDEVKLEVPEKEISEKEMTALKEQLGKLVAQVLGGKVEEKTPEEAAQEELADAASIAEGIEGEAEEKEEEEKEEAEEEPEEEAAEEKKEAAEEDIDALLGGEGEEPEEKPEKAEEPEEEPEKEKEEEEGSSLDDIADFLTKK